MPIDIDPWIENMARIRPRKLDFNGPRVQESLGRLYKLLETLSGAKDSDASLARILEFSCERIKGAEVAAIILLEPTAPARVRLAWQRGLGHLIDLKFNSKLVAKLPSGRVFLLEPERAGVSSGLLVSLKGEQERVGLLYMDNRSRAAAFTEDDLYLANAVGNILSLQLALERQALLARIKQNMQRYFGPEAVQMIIQASQAEHEVRLGFKEQIVTVIFADLVGFTDYSRRSTPAQLSGVLNPFLQTASESIQRFGGHVDKFIGDAVMGIFGGHPLDESSWHEENHALRAVRAGREIISSWAKVRPAPIAVHLGISSGKVAIGNLGFSERMEYSALGEAVILAARLEKLAKPDAITISDSTREMIQGSLPCSNGNTVEIKGFGSVRVWHLG